MLLAHCADLIVAELVLCDKDTKFNGSNAENHGM